MKLEKTDLTLFLNVTDRFMDEILHDIKLQIRLSDNHLIKEPWVALVTRKLVQWLGVIK